MKDRLFVKFAVYESDDREMASLPPFKHFVFVVLEAWWQEVLTMRLSMAKVLILASEDPKIYPEGSVHTINKAYWLHTSAVRIV